MTFSQIWQHIAMIHLIHLQRQSDRRADAYPRHDVVIREVARRMAERLDLIRCQPELVLDVGCGPGRDLADLQGRYPQARLLALDLSEKNLRQFHAPVTTLRRWFQSITASQRPVPAAIQADLAHLPIKNSSVDFLYSNLSLQYTPQPHSVFPEWARVVKPGGLLMFSTLGPDSLQELRSAGLAGSILPLVDMHDLGDMLVEAGFTTPVMDMEKLTLTYKSSEDLLGELHALGGNCLASRRQGLQTPRDWRRRTEPLQHQAQADGRIPLTLEVIYGHAWRAGVSPARQRNEDGRTWVGVPLTQLGGRKKK
ncbi:MAG: methyltransferase domain-containing protein [Burkholderiales bacterium]|nr:methyltransferase domain-containing protein [Burkholderiales bacterium]